MRRSESAHDLKAVATLVEDSPNALFVANAPVASKDIGANHNIMERFHEFYEHPFRIDSNYDGEGLGFRQKEKGRLRALSPASSLHPGSFSVNHGKG